MSFLDRHLKQKTLIYCLKNNKRIQIKNDMCFVINKKINFYILNQKLENFENWKIFWKGKNWSVWLLKNLCLIKGRSKLEYNFTPFGIHKRCTIDITIVARQNEHTHTLKRCDPTLLFQILYAREFVKKKSYDKRLWAFAWLLTRF